MDGGVRLPPDEAAALYMALTTPLMRRPCWALSIVVASVPVAVAEAERGGPERLRRLFICFLSGIVFRTVRNAFGNLLQSLLLNSRVLFVTSTPLTYSLLFFLTSL